MSDAMKIDRDALARVIREAQEGSLRGKRDIDAADAVIAHLSTLPAEDAVRADQIEKDAAIAESPHGTELYEMLRDDIFLHEGRNEAAAAIRAQLNGENDE